MKTMTFANMYDMYVRVLETLLSLCVYMVCRHMSCIVHYPKVETRHYDFCVYIIGVLR